MIYNQRCTIIHYEKKDTILGPEKGPTIEKQLPCSVNSVSYNENVGVFGTFKKSALEVHFQGIVRNIDEIIYQDVRYGVYNISIHRNATVVIIG
ncbi:hypothetical protein [Enterococcus faecalis]|uniref:hypothetical protein n=1 Tax=Enterococcus faecalis TaxID=1351 RepID=UPI003D0C9E4A